MSRIAGLVWDDDPDEFMIELKDILATRGVDLTIRQDVKEFTHLFDVGSWDFVILDIFDDRVSPPLDTGLQLAQSIAAARRREPWYPIFVLTQHVESIRPDIYNRLPLNAVLRGKADLFWTAQYIKEELMQRGVFADRSKIFRIHSLKDRAKYTEFVEPVTDHLSARGLASVIISGSDLVTEILDGLLQKMNQCGAIVAVCTADDEELGGVYQPRQNVLLEMGVALGLHRGLQRLIILQQWGETLEQQARLPTDLGGVLTIRFRKKVSEAFGQVEDRLRGLRMTLL